MRPTALVLLPAFLLATAATGQAPVPCAAADQLPETWTTQDVIDARIDVHAQYAVMRMFSRPGAEAVVASSVLEAVKTCRLGGLFLPDQRTPALHAQSLGTAWWKLLPPAGPEASVHAVCVPAAAGKPPLVVFRESVKSSPAILDPALMVAYSSCGIGLFPPRGYRATLPPKRPSPPPAAAGAQASGSLALLVTRGGSGLSGVTVDVDGPQAATRTTDADGFAFVGQLSPGEYRVTAHPAGRPAQSRTATVPADASSMVHFELEVAPPTSPPSRPSPPEPPSGRGGSGGGSPVEGGTEGAPGKEGQGRCVPSPGCEPAVFAQKLDECRLRYSDCLVGCLFPSSLVACSVKCTLIYQVCVGVAAAATGCCEGL